MLVPADRRSPTRASLGTASLSISSLLVFSSVPKLEKPVTLPPGRARLATKPAPTGSAEFVITMGMVVVALFAANAGGVAETTIRSTLRRTRSAASSGSALRLLLGKPVLDGDILSLDPSKLAQLLPKRLQEDRATRSSAYIQETYAGDFSCLLRLSGNAKRKEQSAKRKTNDFFLHQFSPETPADRSPLISISDLCHLMTRSARASTFGGIAHRFWIFDGSTWLTTGFGF